MEKGRDEARGHAKGSEPRGSEEESEAEGRGRERDSGESEKNTGRTRGPAGGTNAVRERKGSLQKRLVFTVAC